MSLDQRVQVWLSNIQQSTDDPSPVTEPYADVPPNPMKRRRVDSPPRETWPNIKLSPNDPFYDIKKRWLLEEETAIKKIRLQQAKNDMLREELARIENRPLKKRATASNQVSSEVQQQYCNFVSYSTGKVERRLISRVIPAPQPVTTESRTPSSSGWAQLPRSQDVKVEPDTEPVSWPQPVNDKPVAAPPLPILRTIKVEPDIEPPPTTLTTLLKRINDIYAGRGIMSSQLRSTLLDSVKFLSFDKMSWAQGGKESDVHYCPQRHKLGQMPSPMDVERIMYRAAICAKAESPTTEWNMEVVHKILDLSFRCSANIGQDLVDFRSSTDGSIIQDYHPYLGSPQPPDFCVYVDPNCDDEPDIPCVIEDVQKNFKVHPFNHIDLKSLQQRPIAFHIHTLAENTTAELQRVRASFVAHRSFLRRLVGLREKSDNYYNVECRIHVLPDFLLGVIVNKHNWFLSILKPGEENARFYGIGDTATSMGVFKIVCALQVLRDWVEKDYWPWMHKLLFKWPYDCAGKVYAW